MNCAIIPRPELRPLGLHLQLHQEIPQPAGFLMPDRAQVTMERHFLELLCAAADPDLSPPRDSRHGRHGGADPDQERSSGRMKQRSSKVRQDKLREVKAGHDGTWVAHPGLVPVAKAVFDEFMTAPNQYRRTARRR